MTEKAVPSIIKWDIDDPEQAAPLKDTIRQLVDFYTRPEYRYLNQETFDKIKSLSDRDQIMILKDELVNAVLSFHIVKAAELAMEEEKLKRG